jgi:1-phosphofructokinase
MPLPVKIATVTLNPAIDQTVTIPDFKAGGVNRVESMRADAGGKGVNVAAFLADYGVATTATGFLGRENTQLFEHFFGEKKIADRFVRINGSTRTGIKIVDPVRQETTDINYPGMAPASEDIQTLIGVIERLAADHRWFVLAGSIPAGVPPTIYAELIRTVAACGGRVALDTSGEALIHALESVPALIKPNLDELEACLGRRLERRDQVLAAARQLLARGIETVVVSMGAEGALFVEADGTVQAMPPAVGVVSTVGAGDALLSGTLAAKIERRDLSEVARLATAFAMVAVTHIGAGLPADANLEEIAAGVSIDRVP